MSTTHSSEWGQPHVLSSCASPAVRKRCQGAASRHWQLRGAGSLSQACWTSLSLWKAEPRKTQAGRSTAHLRLLLLLEYLLQATGGCTALFISLGPLACATLTKMSQVCFGRGCFLAGASPISTASSRAPEQMTTNVNKAPCDVLETNSELV